MFVAKGSLCVAVICNGVPRTRQSSCNLSGAASFVWPRGRSNQAGFVDAEMPGTNNFGKLRELWSGRRCDLAFLVSDHFELELLDMMLQCSQRSRVLGCPGTLQLKHSLINIPMMLNVCLFACTAIRNA